jgi:hypothetical protein
MESPPPIGSALQVVKYDHVTQKIMIEDSGPSTSTAAVSSHRKDPRVIRQEMQNPAYFLTNVGRSEVEARNNVATGQPKFGKRHKCDTCLFRGPSTNCNWSVIDGCCMYCLTVFGRKFCSWSVDIPSAKQVGVREFPALEQNGDHENIMRRSALVSTPTWGAAKVNEKPKMIELDTDGDEDDAEIEDLSARELRLEAEEEGDYMGTI